MKHLNLFKEVIEFAKVNTTEDIMYRVLETFESDNCELDPKSNILTVGIYLDEFYYDFIVYGKSQRVEIACYDTNSWERVDEQTF